MPTRSNLKMILTAGALLALQACGASPAQQADQRDRPWFDPPQEPHWSERDLRMGWLPPPSPPPQREPTRREPFRQQVEGSGGSWSLVFAHPDADWARGETSPRQFAEYARNDGRLSPRPDTPLLATTEWPERERASLAYPRYISLNNRPDQLLLFENESRYRAGFVGGGYRSAPIAPPEGVWGFWR